jgi:hypothetical protein
MKTVRSQIGAVGKSGAENALKLGLLSLEHAERLLDLNLHNARIALEHGIIGAKAIASATDAQKVIAWRAEFAKVSIREVAAYSRGIYGVAADAEYDFSALALVAWTSCTDALAGWIEMAQAWV